MPELPKTGEEEPQMELPDDMNLGEDENEKDNGGLDNENGTDLYLLSIKNISYHWQSHFTWRALICILLALSNLIILSSVTCISVKYLMIMFYSFDCRRR
jgi:hypothetical protein